MSEVSAIEQRDQRIQRVSRRMYTSFGARVLAAAGSVTGFHTVIAESAPSAGDVKTGLGLALLSVTGTIAERFAAHRRCRNIVEETGKSSYVSPRLQVAKNDSRLSAILGLPMTAFAPALTTQITNPDRLPTDDARVESALLGAGALSITAAMTGIDYLSIRDSVQEYSRQIAVQYSQATPSI